MTKLNQKKKSHKILFISTSVLLLTIALSFYNQKLIKAYYLNAKLNHFKTGDNVYMNKYLISDLSTYKFPLMRLIKSNTASDYTWIASGRSIVDDSLEKYRSSLLGHYLKVEILNLKIDNQKVMARIYAIEPNWRCVNKNDTVPGTLPPNFSFVDSNYYVNWAVVTNQQKVFKK